MTTPTPEAARELLAEIGARRLREPHGMGWLGTSMRCRPFLAAYAEQADEIAKLRASQSKMHARAQLAEAALPEWREIDRATAGQATGRMFPALLRYALTMAREEFARARAECEAWRTAWDGQDWRSGYADPYHDHKIAGMWDDNKPCESCRRFMAVAAARAANTMEVRRG